MNLVTAQSGVRVASMTGLSRPTPYWIHQFTSAPFRAFSTLARLKLTAGTLLDL